MIIFRAISTVVTLNNKRHLQKDDGIPFFNTWRVLDKYSHFFRK